MGKRAKMRQKQRAQMYSDALKACGDPNYAGTRRSWGMSNKWRLQAALPPPDWSSMNLEEVQKDFYREHPHVTARDEATIKEFRDENRISVKGCDCPKPVQAFDECSFSESIMEAVNSQNFVMPTPIQAQSLPIVLSGRDMVGIAETGSGKTLAYILPAVTHILGKVHPGNLGEPDVVVLAPTRELAQQIHQVVKSLGPGIKVSSECFYGGTKKQQQKAFAGKVFEICIATPGRLVAFLSQKLIKFHRCTYFVLDEADKMLDMGFEPTIKMIFSQTRPDRQVLMFSATWPPEIQDLAETYLNNYIRVNIGSLQISANHNITQKVEICGEFDKAERIFKIMKKVLEQKENKTLIFVKSKVEVDILTLRFRLNGWEALGLHGGKKQTERDRVFNEFKTGNLSILIATDVAARGLDVDDIKFIINYDYPRTSEDYVHRIGRTGRCNKKGTAITLFTLSDRDNAFDLISVLEEAGQYVSSELQDLVKLPSLGKKTTVKMPPGLKARWKLVSKVMLVCEVNTLPLGTTTNSECLPDLDDLIDPVALGIAISGKKKKKSGRNKLPISVLIAEATQQQACNPPVNVQPPNEYALTRNDSDSRVQTLVSSLRPSVPNENFQMNSGISPVTERSVKGNVLNVQHFGQKRSPGPVESRGESSVKKMKTSGENISNNNNLGINDRNSMYSNRYHQQQQMGQNYGLSFENASWSSGRRRNEGFCLDSRNARLITGNKNEGMPIAGIHARNIGMPMAGIHAENIGMPMAGIHSRNIGMPMAGIYAGNVGMPMAGIHARNVGSLWDTRIRMHVDHKSMGTSVDTRQNTYNNVSHQNSNWWDYRNNYSLGKADMNRYSVQGSWSENGKSYSSNSGTYGSR